MSKSALVIEQGNHYDNRIFSSSPFIGRTVFTKTVQFTESCAYILPDYNTEDVNKLFGASFGGPHISFKDKTFTGPLHYTSARFGWRWSKSGQCIELLAYCYDKGNRNWDAQMRFPVIASIKIGETVQCSLKVTPTDYIFHVTKGDETIGQYISVPHSKHCSWGFTASLFFGGSQPAPQTIFVWLD